MSKTTRKQPVKVRDDERWLRKSVAASKSRRAMKQDFEREIEEALTHGN